MWTCALIFGTLWRPRTKQKRKNKRSPQGNSKDWGSPHGILCTKSIGVFQVPTLCGHLLFSGPHFVCYTKSKCPRMQSLLILFTMQNYKYYLHTNQIKYAWRMCLTTKRTKERNYRRSSVYTMKKYTCLLVLGRVFVL